MKRKFGISNLILIVLVVCTMMYQSAHSISHVLHEFHEEGTSHSKSHQHNNSKHCYLCDFTFSPFTAVEFQTITFFNSIQIVQKYFFSEITFDIYFVHHSFLRGPPSFI